MRELNTQQKAMILEEVKRNIKKEIDNPYRIKSNTYFKCMELNDHETYHQNVNYYLNELREEEYKKGTMFYKKIYGLQKPRSYK